MGRKEGVRRVWCVEVGGVCGCGGYMCVKGGNMSGEYVCVCRGSSNREIYLCAPT